MNRDEMRYIRTLILTTGMAVYTGVMVIGALLSNDIGASLILGGTALLGLSGLLAANYRGYNRAFWNGLVGWENPPLTEQKAVVEDGEEP